MTFRMMEQKDLEMLFDLFNEFVKESLDEYDVDLNIKFIKKVAGHYVETSFVAEKDGKIVGVLAGDIIGSPSFNTPIYQEQVWFFSKVHRFHGIGLLKFAESILKDCGVSHIVMANMANSKAEKLARFYKRMNYKTMEIHYIKAL